MSGLSAEQQAGKPEAASCDVGMLASVDILLTEASARLEQLPGPALAAARHIVTSALAIIRHQLDPDAQPLSPIALNEARAAVVTATYAVRHIHDATIRG